MLPMHALLAALLALFCVLAPAGCATPGTPPGGTGTPGAAAVSKNCVWSRSMEAKRVALDKPVAGTGITVLRTKDKQLQINGPSGFSFDTDSAAIKPGMRPVLNEVAEDLNTEPMSRTVILVVGHNDSRCRSSVTVP